MLSLQHLSVSRVVRHILVISLLRLQHFQLIIIFVVILFVALDVYHLEVAHLGGAAKNIRILVILLKFIVRVNLDSAYEI